MSNNQQPLSPQGYNLGRAPKNTNPFFDIIRRGVTATVNVGRVIVNTLTAGSDATVSIENSGTETDGVFDFTFGIPAGPQGPAGADGQNGANGVTPEISATATVDQTVGMATVSVSKSGTDEAPVFNFAFSGIKGQDGSGSGGSLPSGGNPGQVLEKYGSGDGEAYWADKNQVDPPNSGHVGMYLKALGEGVYGWAGVREVPASSSGDAGKYLQCTPTGYRWREVNPTVKKYAMLDAVYATSDQLRDLVRAFESNFAKGMLYLDGTAGSYTLRYVGRTYDSNALAVSTATYTGSSFTLAYSNDLKIENTNIKQEWDSQLSADKYILTFDAVDEGRSSIMNSDYKNVDTFKLEISLTSDPDTGDDVYTLLGFYLLKTYNKDVRTNVAYMAESDRVYENPVSLTLTSATFIIVYI